MAAAKARASRLAGGAQTEVERRDSARQDTNNRQGNGVVGKAAHAPQQFLAITQRLKFSFVLIPDSRFLIVHDVPKPNFSR
jgi:hypothetical protein